LFIGIVFSLNTHAQSEFKDSKIAWRTGAKLEWTDFQGKPPENDGITKAETSSEIIISAEYFEGEIPNFKVRNSFIKNKSWTRTNSKKVLLHEQLHFDISQLFARKISKKFSELKNNGELDVEAYIAEFDRLRNEEEKLQQKYDSETNFIDDKKIMNQWVKFIEQELDKLKKFKVEH
tara:strand:+ start:106 stop:636 length:531 start_codon:yes stop_codon:yes gene_type:complete